MRLLSTQLRNVLVAMYRHMYENVHVHVQLHCLAHYTRKKKECKQHSQLTTAPQLRKVRIHNMYMYTCSTLKYMYIQYVQCTCTECVHYIQSCTLPYTVNCTHTCTVPCIYMYMYGFRGMIYFTIVIFCLMPTWSSVSY